MRLISLMLVLLASCTISANQLLDATLSVDGQKIDVIWENNKATQALRNLLLEGEITVTASEYGGFEQVGSLPRSLPDEDRHLSASCGDIMLYNNKYIVLFYGSNNWSYTKLGHIDMSISEIRRILDKSGITIRLSL